MLKANTEDDPPRPLSSSSTPFPTTDDPSDAAEGGDTELIEPLGSATTKPRGYPSVPGSAREVGFPKDVALAHSTGTRPRRSASLSDALSCAASTQIYICIILMP